MMLFSVTFQDNKPRTRKSMKSDKLPDRVITMKEEITIEDGQ